MNGILSFCIKFCFGKIAVQNKAFKRYGCT